MLSEIHHRVKNNLQVITSLLRLQLYKIDNEETAAPFNESIDRISSMSLIHEKMYQGNQVSNIDLEEYIHDLANSLAQNYAYETKVELQVRSSVKSIDLNYIVPFSLILNEIITNSIKHGFKNTKSGSISIKLALNKAGRLKFDYIDSGTWQPQLDQNSFGLELIETFSEQIGGTYKVSTNAQTEYNFVFSDDIVAK
jgi:two-component sensor histidine kinase